MTVEPKLTYALDSISKRLISIEEVEKGVKCNCVCPKCQKALIAKKGAKKQHHFAHQQDSDCEGYYMTAMHLLAEQIIEENKCVMLPKYKSIDAQIISFKSIEKEQRIDRKDLQPDIVGITAEGERWAIEICYTHAVDDTKKKKIMEAGISCVEIDISQQRLDKDLLSDFLLKSAENREWINNPNYDKEIEYRQEIEDWKYLKNCSPLFISNIMDIDLLYTCLDENVVLVMEDKNKFLIEKFVQISKDIIIVLHKDYAEHKTITPFHLIKIYQKGNGICYEKIADFMTEREAINRFKKCIQ